MIGLYIHIPFCDQKCAYCDFLSFPGRHSVQKAQYLDALCAEMCLRLRGRWQHPQTIFIGGGTPTALSVDELRTLLQTLARCVDLAGVEEFTV